MQVPEPHRTYQIPVDSPHVLSVKEYGSKTGIPVVFLHGGPGSGCSPLLCRLFDLSRFRVIASDQRGAGDSTPKASVQQNTTQQLVEDLELIRCKSEVEQWLMVGGSWGALLAIAYAETYPQAVAGMILRSLFLGTDEELYRAFITLPKTFYPEIYQAFVSLLTEEERKDVLVSYYQRILHDDPKIAIPASYAWHNYERILSRLNPPLPDSTNDFAEFFKETKTPPATPRMEAHYFSNHCFLEPDQLIRNASRLADIRCNIVQARYDLLCPPLTASTLSAHWPASKIVFVEAAGHSQSEASVEQSLIQSVEEIAEEIF